METIHAIDYSKRLELFETACEVFAVPMEVRLVWSCIRFFSWFRATLIFVCFLKCCLFFIYCNVANA